MAHSSRGYYPEVPIKDRPKPTERWRRKSDSVVVRIVSLEKHAYYNPSRIDVVWSHIGKRGGGMIDLGLFWKRYELVTDKVPV